LKLLGGITEPGFDSRHLHNRLDSLTRHVSTVLVILCRL